MRRHHERPHATGGVSSDPPGAQVFIGDESLGVTPVIVDLPRRERDLVLRLEKDGFVTGEVPVQVIIPTNSGRKRRRTLAVEAGERPRRGMIETANTGMIGQDAGNSWPDRSRRIRVPIGQVALRAGYWTRRAALPGGPAHHAPTNARPRTCAGRAPTT